MRTSPYIPFYPADFLVGTMFMTAEETGAYIRLLCFQWQQGGIPQDEERQAKIAGVPTKKLAAVIAKFTPSEDGTLKNGRMEEEREKVESFRDRQTQNGRKGGRPRKPDESQGKPTENPRVISGLDLGKPRKSQSESESESETKAEAETRQGGAVEDDPPTLEEGIRYATSGSSVPISEEVVKSWHADRQKVGWKVLKAGHSYPMKDWRSDLRNYSQTWRRNDQERAAQRPGPKPNQQIRNVC